ncbi:hypothetical protein FSP39_016775 [Pinctada imbricata]|uniref:G-protein coupled receptors family 1 profile domain-containing protein n=1 Tax=Pinctada imbricata TaxID=66713 RepID=A0AA89BUW5_PINIB|nr:hypothetical protein FSP39_016775 [Pinctada imbricata]
MNLTAFNEGIDGFKHHNVSINVTTGSAPPETPMYILVIAAVFFLVIFIVGLIGNLYIIALVCGLRHMRTKMGLLFMNLSITDLLVVMICMPGAAVDVFANEAWLLGEIACKFVYFIESVVMIASASTVLVIGIDRYLAICKSTTDNAWKRLKIGTKITGIWTLAILSCAPVAFIGNIQEDKIDDGTIVKRCVLIFDRNWKIGYIISVFVVLFSLILVVLPFLIQRMASKLLRSSNLFEGQIKTKRIRERRRVVVMLCLVAVSFFVCILPSRVVIIWFVFAEEKLTKELGWRGRINLKIFIQLMMYLNSALSPVIYNSMSTNVRKVTASLLRKWCKLCKKKRKYNIGNQNEEKTHRNPDLPGRQKEFNVVQISIIQLNQQ